jgi:RNA polymerase-interacting CarD/CdnL/TRCF family regulator
MKGKLSRKSHPIKEQRMTDKEITYTVGDWIVHHIYGVGQVKKVEKKLLNQTKTLYYKVQANDSIFWIPVKKADSDHIRPLSSASSLKRALRLLKKAPHEMDSNYKKRELRINRIRTEGKVSSICQMIRDLSAKEREKPLNTKEKRALEAFKDLLLREWSVCVGITIQDAQRELQDALQESWMKMPVEG